MLTERFTSLDVKSFIKRLRTNRGDQVADVCEKILAGMSGAHDFEGDDVIQQALESLDKETQGSGEIQRGALAKTDT